MHTKLIPLGLAAVAVGLLFVATAPAAAKPAIEPPQPQPPGGQPQPAIPQVPGVTPNLDVLRGQIATLLGQATIAPNTVDPNQLDLLAAQLDQSGLAAEAAQVSAKARDLRVLQAQQIPVL